MTPNNPTPGDELVERLRRIGPLELTEDGLSLRVPYDGDVDGDGRSIVVGGDVLATFEDSDDGEILREFVIASLESLRTRDEAARSSTTEVELLRTALSDMLWAFVDARSAGDSAEALSIQQTDAETLAREALQSKDYSHEQG